MASLKVAVTQAEPVWLDLKASVDKACKLIAEAASNGAKLVAFPEVWFPGYPGWIWARPVDPVLVTTYTLNSMAVDGPEMARLQAAARENTVAVAFGFSERTPSHSIYISQAIVAPDGSLALQRRKLKPTHMERTMFGDGSGADLSNVAEIDFGGGVGRVRVSTLACWEHTQPLLKYHTISQSPAVHVAMWPPLDPFPGADSPGLWSMSADGCQALSQALAVEGAAYVVHSTAVLQAGGIEMMKTHEGLIFREPGGGHSCVIGPDGRRVTAPLGDGKPTAEGLVYADLDLTRIVATKSFLDTVGHYSRPDLLWLGVDKKQKNPVVPLRSAGDEGAKDVREAA